MLDINQIKFWNKPLGRLQHWIETIEIHNAKLAWFLCKTIPAQCPFARNIELFHHTLFQIPPLCKLNPFYEQIISLRFRSLSYLADECGEDITPYCH